jgi:hypothetical protein
MFSNRRPSLTRSNAADWRAASAGDRIPGPQRKQKLQRLRCRRERRTQRPSVEAIVARRQQNTAEAKPIGRDSDLAQMAEVGRAMAKGRPQIWSITTRRKKPEQVQLLLFHVLALHTSSLTLMSIGMRPSAHRRFATSCWLWTISSFIGSTMNGARSTAR